MKAQGEVVPANWPEIGLVNSVVTFYCDEKVNIYPFYHSATAQTSANVLVFMYFNGRINPKMDMTGTGRTDI